MPGGRRARRVGRYHLLDRVACGGMAEVYRAKVVDPDGTERLIGLKKVLDMYSTDRNFLRALVAEYHLSALLHHPNIAEIYELIRVPEGYFIAMEYVDGKDLRGTTLRAIEQRRGFDVLDAAYLMAHALNGLDYAHNACAEDGTPLHLVHRDFSPSNVLVSYDGSVKIIDFGIAKAAVPRDQTAAGVIKGKVRYMSPEQANGDPRLTAQSDVFSAGSVLYELLAGRPAFQAPNELEMIYAVRRAQPASLDDLAPHVPVQLREIVRRAMARSRRERFRSAGEFRDALVDFLREHAPTYKRTRLANFMRLLWEPEIEQEIAALFEFAISDEPAAAAENLLALVNTNESLAAAGLAPVDVYEPAPSGPYPSGHAASSSATGTASEEPATRAVGRAASSRSGDSSRAPSPAPATAQPPSRIEGAPRATPPSTDPRSPDETLPPVSRVAQPAPTLTGVEPLHERAVAPSTPAPLLHGRELAPSEPRLRESSLSSASVPRVPRPATPSASPPRATVQTPNASRSAGAPQPAPTAPASVRARDATRPPPLPTIAPRAAKADAPSALKGETLKAAAAPSSSAPREGPSPLATASPPRVPRPAPARPLDPAHEIPPAPNHDEREPITDRPPPPRLASVTGSNAPPVPRPRIGSAPPMSPLTVDAAKSTTPVEPGIAAARPSVPPAVPKPSTARPPLRPALQSSHGLPTLPSAPPAPSLDEATFADRPKKP